MNRVFVDMDGVVVDFQGFMDEMKLTSPQIKVMPGAYRHMKPIAGAIEGLQVLISMGFVVWLATKPPTGIAFAYGDKAAWVFETTPWLKRRLIITHDKGLLGDRGDFLVDDNPQRANCQAFPGELIHFRSWPQVIARMREVAVARRYEPEPTRSGD